MLISLVSARHSPGASVAALALGWVWPRHAVVAECDPAGGEALLALDPAQTHGNRGLFEMLVNARMMAPNDALWNQAVLLPDGGDRHWLLGGTRSPKETASVDWPRLAELFATLDGVDVDVLADCGPLFAAGLPRPVVERSDLTVVVLRNDVRSIRSMSWWMETVRDRTGGASRGADAVVALVVEQDPLVAGYSVKEIDTHLRQHGIPVAGMLPWDPESAAVLAHGRDAGRRFPNSPLLKAARTAATDIGHRAWQRRERLRLQGPAAGPAPGSTARTSSTVVANAEPLVARRQRPVPRRDDPAEPDVPTDSALEALGEPTDTVRQESPGRRDEGRRGHGDDGDGPARGLGVRDVG